MFGVHYLKPSPNTYLIAYRGGRVRREGAGLSMVYFAPTTSLVAVPLADQEAPFALREVSLDFQEVTLQGAVTFRVAAPGTLAQRMDFSLKRDGSGYASEDPVKLAARVLTAVQVQLRHAVQQHSLDVLLREGGRIASEARAALSSDPVLAELGVELVTLSLLAIRPSPETARALEADVREQILKRADDATYARRNSAIDQERAIRENELRTDLAVEAKQRQLREARIESDRAAQALEQAMQAQALTAKVAREEQRAEWVELKVANERKRAEGRADGVRALVAALEHADPQVLQALAAPGADPGALIAMAFQGLAQRAERIGELNISPELLQSLTRQTGKR
jgi:hypothetical protein